jgi:rubredoxin
MEIKATSIITCPVCGYRKEEEMPLGAWQHFYECENCETILKPEAGDVCVFCSHGTDKMLVRSTTQ